MLPASLRSVESALLRRTRIPLCVPHPWVTFDSRLFESAYMVVVCRQRGPIARRPMIAVEA